MRSVWSLAFFLLLPVTSTGVPATHLAGGDRVVCWLGATGLVCSDKDKRTVESPSGLGAIFNLYSSRNVHCARTRRTLSCWHWDRPREVVAIPTQFRAEELRLSDDFICGQSGNTVRCEGFPWARQDPPKPKTLAVAFGEGFWCESKPGEIDCSGEIFQQPKSRYRIKPPAKVTWLGAFGKKVCFHTVGETARLECQDLSSGIRVSSGAGPRFEVPSVRYLYASATPFQKIEIVSKDRLAFQDETGLHSLYIDSPPNCYRRRPGEQWCLAKLESVPPTPTPESFTRLGERLVYSAEPRSSYVQIEWREPIDTATPFDSLSVATCEPALRSLARSSYRFKESIFNLAADLCKTATERGKLFILDLLAPLVISTNSPLYAATIHASYQRQVDEAAFHAGVGTLADHGQGKENQVLALRILLSSVWALREEITDPATREIWKDLVARLGPVLAGSPSFSDLSRVAGSLDQFEPLTIALRREPRTHGTAVFLTTIREFLTTK